MVTPSYLSPGDTVGIVSTARKLTKEELSPALDILSGWGLLYKLGQTIGAEADQFAGDDAVRAADFQAMLDDPDIKAIWCARGGYGTVRIIDALDFGEFSKNPKWIVGYSDITVLHSHLNVRGIETLHAQMPLELEKKSPETASSIQSALFGNELGTIKTTSHSLNRPGEGSGELVGGNLSVIYSLCGSDSALKTNNNILFLEDLDEYLYHVDRMLKNLKRNGLFEGINGLVVGGMTDMNDNAIPFGKTAEEIVLETVAEYNFPVCFGFPAGHLPDNRAMIFGREVSLEIHESGAAISFK